MMDKGFLESTEMSWKAKGLLAYILSKPDNWKVTVGDVIKHASDGKTAVYSGLAELKVLGYYEKAPVRDDRGIFSHWESTVYELPKAVNPENTPLYPLPGFPEMDNPEMGCPEMDNQPRLNNDFSNIDLMTAAFAVWDKSQNKTSEATRQMVIDAQKSTEAIKILSDAVKNSSDNFSSTITGMTVNAQVANNLKDEIIALAHETNLSADENANLHTKIDQLNTLLPDLNLKYDDHLKILSLTNKELEDSIKYYTARIKLQAAEAQQLEVEKQKVQIAFELAKANEELADAQDKFYKKNEKLSAQLSVLAMFPDTGVSSKTEKGVNELNAMSKVIDTLQANVDGLVASQADLDQQTQFVADIINECRGEMDDTAGAIVNLSSKTDDYNDLLAKQKDLLDGVAASMKTAQDAINTLLNDQKLSADQIMGLVDLYPELSKVRNYWLLVLLGERTADKEYIKIVMDRYHEKVKE